jgi:hypothetical protein
MRQTGQYFVSRQFYLERYVEVAEDRDCAGPDAMSAVYAGEMREYANPITALEVAFRLRDQWQTDLDKNGVGEKVPVGIMFCGSEGTDEELRTVAQAECKVSEHD